LQVAAGLQPELWLRRHDWGCSCWRRGLCHSIMAFQDALQSGQSDDLQRIGEAYYGWAIRPGRGSLQQAITPGQRMRTPTPCGWSYAQLNRCDGGPNLLRAGPGDGARPYAGPEAKDLCRQRGRPIRRRRRFGRTATPSAAQELHAGDKSPSRPAALSGRIASRCGMVRERIGHLHRQRGRGAPGLVAEESPPAGLSPDGTWLP